MKKKMIKNLLLVALMAVLCVAVGMTASALEEPTGQCGDNVYWNFNETTGELVISGEGDMWDYLNGESPFSYKNYIKTIIVEDSVHSIGNYAFYACNNLTSIDMGNGIIKIGEWSFSSCESLIDITMPDSVTEIGERAFSRCDGLTSVVIPDGVISIGDCAFRVCKNLVNIEIPDSVMSIGDTILGACYNLTNITVDKNNEYYSSDDSGILFNKDKTVLMQYPIGNTRKSYTIPDGVITIAKESFAECNFIADVYIPNSVKYIEELAFNSCFSLLDINMPDGVIYVGEYAFEAVTAVNITISSTVKNIGLEAFGYMPFLEKVIIKSMDVKLDSSSLCKTYTTVVDISREELLDLMIRYYATEDPILEAEIAEHMIYLDEPISIGTICCHAGSTAETYAIENGVDYVLTHFYEGDWTYDYDNMIRYRKCIHCDELETELLETTTDGDVEIIEPNDPDTDFTVDVVTDYVIIEEALENNVAGDFEIVKAFDITLKNSDGVHVQPDGTVKVKLPLDWSKDGVYKVYRVNDDDTLTDMNAYRQGSHMVFDTDHFSIYVIVDESVQEEAPEEIPEETPDEETNDDFFSKIIDLITSFFELILSWFDK